MAADDETLLYQTEYQTQQRRYSAKGSARIRRTTLIFQALLVLAMIVAFVTTVLAQRSADVPTQSSSPDAAPPAAFVFHSD